MTMHRLTVRITQAQYDALAQEGEPFAAQVRALVEAHFDIGARTFTTSQGTVAIPQKTLREMKAVSYRGKVQAIKVMRDALRVKTPGGHMHCPWKLRTCKDIADQLWTEWGLPELPSPTGLNVGVESDETTFTVRVNGTPFTFPRSTAANLQDSARRWAESSRALAKVRTTKVLRSITGLGLQEARGAAEHLLRQWGL